MSNCFQPLSSPQATERWARQKRFSQKWLEGEFDIEPSNRGGENEAWEDAVECSEEDASAEEEPENIDTRLLTSWSPSKQCQCKNSAESQFLQVQERKDLHTVHGSTFAPHLSLFLFSQSQVGSGSWRLENVHCKYWTFGQLDKIKLNMLMLLFDWSFSLAPPHDKLI